jgi:hypothetical protein
MVPLGRAGSGGSGRSLTRPRGGSDPRLSRFLRGLALGALVGAAVAGSAFWRREGRLAKQAESDTTER